MQRQILRQVAVLARQATTAAGEAGSQGPGSAIGDALGAFGACHAAVRGWQPGSWSSAASAAATQLHQPWLRFGMQRGLSGWAVQQGSMQQLGSAELLGPCHPPTQQQWRAMSARRELTNASSSSSPPEGLTLSDSAVERLKELQEELSGPVALRVIVEGGGCSGFQYEFAIEEGVAAQQLGETDRLFERGGVRVVCDDISLEFLRGATVDFESELMRSAFVIHNNPNAASSCGCGSSFVAK